VPPPSAVFTTLGRERAELWRAAGETALTSLLGFAASAVFGIAAAVALSSARWVQRAFYPYAVFFQTVPIIAIAPLLVIWIGYGWRTVAVSAFIVSAFPIVANTLSGLLSTDPALRDLFRLYGAGRAATLWKLRLPYALPATLTGLRVAAGLAVIGAIVGEFITSRGLGGVIDVSRTQQRVDKVFAGILLASLLGLTLFLLVNLISRIALRHWHASEQN
jgi:NitT/TauT family transport system permease protein